MVFSPDIERRFLLRVASDEDALPEEMSPEMLREIDKNDDLIPVGIWPMLKRAFTPRGMPFFEFYIQLSGIPRDEFDKTLDEIRRLVQQVDGDIFRQIIQESQGVALGKEWFQMAQHGAGRFHLDKKIMELMTSPYVGRSLPPGT